MHEMSYCEGVLEAVLRRASGRPVARVGVRIGAVHRVQLAAAGGPAEGATTDLVVVPVQGHCMDCRADFSSADPAPACPSCGSLEVAAYGGDEVVLEWLQYVDTAGSAASADRQAEVVPPHTHLAAAHQGGV